MPNDDRKARLKALREAAAKKEQNSDDGPEQRVDSEEPSTLKFRNYIVKDESIKHKKVCVCMRGESCPCLQFSSIFESLVFDCKSFVLPFVS